MISKEKYFFLDNSKKNYLEKKRDGVYPYIITIDGFLNEGNNENGEWETILHTKFKNNAWLHLHWESENKSKLIKGILSGGILSSRLIISPLFRPTVAIKKSWNNALKKSEEIGKNLSRSLENYQKNNENYILLGHSLGSRVIYFCLKEHYNNKVQVVKEVHLLGGAVENHAEKWLDVEKSVKNKIFNYYTKNDKVLKFAYQLGTFKTNPIGRNIIASKKAINKDVSKQVKGHLDFKKEFTNYV